MNNIRKRPPPPPPPGPRETKQIKGSYFVEFLNIHAVLLNKTIASFLLLSFIIYYGVVLFSQTYHNNVLWDVLKGRSNEHALMANSYLECREKLFPDSKSECHLVALNYGRELGFENADTIFNEIVFSSQ
jgi:hypothetical protein